MLPRVVAPRQSRGSTGSPSVRSAYATGVSDILACVVGRYHCTTYTYYGAPFRAWLYRIAHNLAINALKRARFTVGVEDLDRVAKPVTNPAIRMAAQIEEDELRAAPRAALPQERAALEGSLGLAARLRTLPRPAPLPAPARAAMATQVLSQVAAQRSASTGSIRALAPSPPRAFDSIAMLAGVLRALGYRGPLSRTWLRLASVAIALVLALVLSAGALEIIDAIANTYGLDVASGEPGKDDKGKDDKGKDDKGKDD